MYIETNIGQIPVEDYLDIKAMQYGFDDYEDMQKNGLHIEIKNLNNGGKKICQTGVEII